MVNASIQKCPVMGYQDKSLFPTQVLAHQFPSPDIQVVRGFINEQKVILFGKENRQLEFRPFSVA